MNGTTYDVDGGRAVDGGNPSAPSTGARASPRPRRRLLGALPGRRRPGGGRLRRPGAGAARAARPRRRLRPPPLAPGGAREHEARRRARRRRPRRPAAARPPSRGAAAPSSSAPGRTARTSTSEFDARRGAVRRHLRRGQRLGFRAAPRARALHAASARSRSGFETGFLQDKGDGRSLRRTGAALRRRDGAAHHPDEPHAHLPLRLARRSATASRSRSTAAARSSATTGGSPTAGATSGGEGRDERLVRHRRRRLPARHHRPRASRASSTATPASTTPGSSSTSRRPKIDDFGSIEELGPVRRRSCPLGGGLMFVF